MGRHLLVCLMLIAAVFILVDDFYRCTNRALWWTRATTFAVSLLLSGVWRRYMAHHLHSCAYNLKHLLLVVGVFASAALAAHVVFYGFPSAGLSDGMWFIQACIWAFNGMVMSFAGYALSDVFLPKKNDTYDRNQNAPVSDGSGFFL